MLYATSPVHSCSRFLVSVSLPFHLLSLLCDMLPSDHTIFVYIQRVLYVLKTSLHASAVYHHLLFFPMYTIVPFDAFFLFVQLHRCFIVALFWRRLIRPLRRLCRSRPVPARYLYLGLNMRGILKSFVASSCCCCTALSIWCGAPSPTLPSTQVELGLRRVLASHALVPPPNPAGN